MTTVRRATTEGSGHPVDNYLGELTPQRVFVRIKPKASHLVDPTDTTRRAPCLRCHKQPAGYWHGYTPNEAVRAETLPLCKSAPRYRQEAVA